jgi:hypothetical protein
MGQSRLLFNVSQTPGIGALGSEDSPLSSEYGLSFLSNRKPQRSVSGIGILGNLDSEGILRR